MSKSLETIITDFKPSPLQKAAIKRIHEFKNELKQYGMYVRSAIELEFMVQDENGMIIPAVIDLEKAHAFLNDQEKLPFIQKVDVEGELARRMKMESMVTQYEINIGDDCTASLNRPKEFAPELIAGVAEQLKKKSLKRLLQESSCLTTAAQSRAFGQYSPNLEAYPHADAAEGSIHHNTETSSLHVNVSLFDGDGRNLLALSKELREHCAHSMIELQHQAAIAVLPNENSHRRIGANTSAPGGLGVTFNKAFGGNKFTSVTVRGYPDDVHDDETRIENRLPGADADPFVAMAFSMAALVNTVREHVQKTKKDSGTISIKVAPVLEKHYAKYDIPKTRDGLVRSYTSPKNSVHLRGLLGTELYEEILNEYQGHSLAV